MKKLAILCIFAISSAYAGEIINKSGAQARELYEALDASERYNPRTGKTSKGLGSLAIGCTKQQVSNSSAFSYDCAISVERTKLDKDKVYDFLKAKEYKYNDSTRSSNFKYSKYIAGIEFSHRKALIYGTNYFVTQYKKVPELVGDLRSVGRRVWTKTGPVYKQIFEELFVGEREIVKRNSEGRITAYWRSKNNVLCAKTPLKRGLFSYKCEVSVTIKTRMVGAY
ncbi:MAG: hypothetical protein KAG61_12260 [Bacteriovoracaceae bacterium]|nr:hypothetical protein [Bacteriovoracaceae bacterium]